MENNETQAPCTYELRVTMLDAKETMYISMNDHGKHLMTIVCIIDRIFFSNILIIFLELSECFMNTDLTKFYRSKITWARGMYNQYASCQIVKFGLLRQILYSIFIMGIYIYF